MSASTTRIAVPFVALGLLTVAGPARADDPAPTTGGITVSSEAEAKTGTDAASGPWIKRFTPQRGVFEVGVFTGLWAPADDLELHSRNLPYRQYASRAGEIGGRLGYYPLRHFGLEGELAMMPTHTRTDQRAFVYSARAHVVVQLGLYRVVPFVVLGGGTLAVNSEDNAVGDDSDQILSVGGGVKYLFTDRLQLRLDVRDVMSPKRGRTVNDPADSLEVLLGFSVLFGRRNKVDKPVEIVPDTDGDGFLDDKDACIDEIGIAPDGCPVRDSDADGFADDVDDCPELAGDAPDGCPALDSDEDGFVDPEDACPQEAGVPPDGCPIRDVDDDGIYPPDDKCPQEPETRNGFEDADGCPDELPEEIKKFTGVIEGIYFATGKASIEPKSTALLDSAAKVLKDFPDFRVEISGHTDSVGNDGKNLSLSSDRAASVKQYLVDTGIAADRIETRGAGEAQPIADNKTKEGRASNRRIEFKILLPETPGAKDEPTPANDDAEKAEPKKAEPKKAEPKKAASEQAAKPPAGSPQ